MPALSIDDIVQPNEANQFIAKMNEYIDSQHTVEYAIRKAIDYCIENDTLADILIKCKSEVTNMLLTEFDEKLYKKLYIGRVTKTA